MLVKFINENNIKFANRKNILMFENKQVNRIFNTYL